MSGNFFAVYDHFLYAFFHVLRIPDTYVIDALSERACELEIAESMVSGRVPLSSTARLPATRLPIQWNFAPV